MERKQFYYDPTMNMARFGYSYESLGKRIIRYIGNTLLILGLIVSSTIFALAISYPYLIVNLATQ